MEEGRLNKLSIQAQQAALQARATLRVALEILTRHRREVLISAGVFISFILLAGVAELFTKYFHYAAIVDARLADQSLQHPAGIYAAPRRVSIGQHITSEELSEHLLRAGYLANEQASKFSAGSFTWQADGLADSLADSLADGLTIQTNEFARRDDLPASVRLSFNKGTITRIEDTATRRKLNSFSLPAEMLTVEINAKKQTRQATGFDELPPVLIKALTSIEDRQFFEHRGVDLFAIARALVKNLINQKIREGGSTITQQLVKNQFLTAERTWQRKFAEIMMAIALERRLSKEQIFALYCDRIYLGHSGITSIYGFKQAARVFFDKDLKDLSHSEAALLSGLVQAPNRYSPYEHADEALARRNVVLNAMADAGAITAAEAAAAKSEAMAVVPPQKLDDTAAPYFVDYLKRELDRHQISEEDQAHLRIETTLDLDLQAAANQAVREHLSRLNKLVTKKRPEAALVALNPHTGEILAMVGGSDYATSQLNRVTDAMRQPGSVFKPIVYAAAMTRGVSPTTTFTNARQEFEFGYKAVYRPENFGHSYSNQAVMLREGIVRSLNVVAVEAAMQVGLGYIAEMAERIGLPRPSPYPSMALGAFEATPLDVARAYTTFANDGIRVDPFAIRAVKLYGQNLVTGEPTKAGALSSSMAYLVTDALMDVVNRGTASRIRRLGYLGPAAGKTGTSRDAWFVGYTPNLLVVVWVGHDDNSDLKLTGGEAAVPIWASFVKRALQLRPDLAAKQFARPAGLEIVEIDPDTGMIANEFCPHRQQVLTSSYLLPGACFQHQAPAIADEDAILDTGSIPPVSVTEPPPSPTPTIPPMQPESPGYLSPPKHSRPKYRY